MSKTNLIIALEHVANALSRMPELDGVVNVRMVTCVSSIDGQGIDDLQKVKSRLLPLPCYAQSKLLLFSRV